MSEVSLLLGAVITALDRLIFLLFRSASAHCVDEDWTLEQVLLVYLGVIAEGVFAGC